MEEGVWHRETGCGTERQDVAQRDRVCYVGVDDKGDERNCG